MSVATIFPALLVSFLTPVPLAAPADRVEELLVAGRAALRQGEPEKALASADQAIALDPKSTGAHFLRGVAHDALERHADAVKDFSRVLELDPKVADAYDRRGSSHFKLAHIAEAIADFDAFLKLRPDQTAGHWRRGIACYYAGRFDEGRLQFEGYQKVDANDVENAVWRYLCMARAAGVDKARADLMKVGKDERVPMMTVYELFAGRAKPADVLAAARDARQALFYAHLYLGLYHEAAGEQRAARDHLTKAVQEYKVPNSYMWDVARVHVELLNKATKDGNKPTPPEEPVASLTPVVLFACSAACHADGPNVADVVRNPENYAGKTLEFRDLSMSGTVTKYDVAGVRKHYLTVQTPGQVFEIGFFMAPPSLADKLSSKLNPRENYAVRLTCKVEQITINGVAQWHGIVTRVALVDQDGNVTDTIQADKK